MGHTLLPEADAAPRRFGKGKNPANSNRSVSRRKTAGA